MLAIAPAQSIFQNMIALPYGRQTITEADIEAVVDGPTLRLAYDRPESRRV